MCRSHLQAPVNFWADEGSRATSHAHMIGGISLLTASIPYELNDQWFH